MLRLMQPDGLDQVLAERLRGGMPALGTCAGMILLAKQVSGLDMEPLGVMDIDVTRNAFGRQVDSFETDLDIAGIGEPPFHAVFIRAPSIERVGDGVNVLARMPGGIGVAARQGNMVALAFHPELTDDVRLHDYFCRIVRDAMSTSRK